MDRGHANFLRIVALLLAGAVVAGCLPATDGATERPKDAATKRDPLPRRPERRGEAAPGARREADTAAVGATHASPLPPPMLPARFETEGPIVRSLSRLTAQARRNQRVKAVGVALIDLREGRGYGVEPHRVFRPASVIKLAVMVAAYDAARTMPPAAFDRLRSDIRRMIVASDNPATRRLVNRLGKQRINATMRRLGLPGLSLGQGTDRHLVLVGSKATAAETALLLARLARREIVSREASEEMLALLGDQERRRRIPAGLFAVLARDQEGETPPDLPTPWVGNKTGTLAGLVHDAGIVLDPARNLAYTLAIFTEGAPSEAAGEQLCRAISAAVYLSLTDSQRKR